MIAKALLLTHVHKELGDGRSPQNFIEQRTSVEIFIGQRHARAIAQKKLSLGNRKGILGVKRFLLGLCEHTAQAALARWGLAMGFHLGKQALGKCRNERLLVTPHKKGIKAQI